MFHRRGHAAAAFLLAAVGASTVPAVADDRIAAMFPTWPGYAPVMVAEELGYFKEEGLDLSWRFEDDRSIVMAAMARGDIDMDMRTIGEHQGKPRDASTPGIIIGTIDVSLGGDGVVVDQSIESAADLKGKIFASEPNVPARLLLQVVLKKAGLTLHDVKLKEVATADSVTVFSDPSIAGLATYEPYLSQLLKLTSRPGAKILVSSKDFPGIITDIITARNDALVRNPEKFRKFLRGVYRAIDFYKKDPQKFVEIAAPYFSMSPAELKGVIDSGLVYTGYEDAVGYLGRPGAPGKLFGLFDEVMELNLEYGAATTKLDAALQIDNELVTGLFDGKTR
jgi:NitT/TauT family transport system substrate-binding protein